MEATSRGRARRDWGPRRKSAKGWSPAGFASFQLTERFWLKRRAGAAESARGSRGSGSAREVVTDEGEKLRRWLRPWAANSELASVGVGLGGSVCVVAKGAAEIRCPLHGSVIKVAAWEVP